MDYDYDDGYDPFDDLPPKEEPDCPACCDSGYRMRGRLWRRIRPCDGCNPTWLDHQRFLFRWRVIQPMRIRWRRITRPFRNPAPAGNYNNEPPF